MQRMPEDCWRGKMRYAVSIALFATTVPTQFALAQDSVFQNNLNYVFFGRADVKEHVIPDGGHPKDPNYNVTISSPVRILDPDLCYVQVKGAVGNKIEWTRYYLKRFKLETMKITSDGYLIAIHAEGDGPIAENSDPIRGPHRELIWTPSNKASIPILGDVEITKSAWADIFSKFCRPYMSKVRI
jgi:hypothetical protein